MTANEREADRQLPASSANRAATNVTGWIAQELNESGLDDEVGLLVLAALEGDAELDEHLAAGATGRVRDIEATADVDAGEHRGAFLTSIAVEGFRGIGPEAKLELKPAPGLTIVAGRNGSGKSSFSEALEYALTGDTYRWKERSVQWQEKWRNLHHSSARIEVGLVEESTGPFTISAAWADDQSKVDTATTTTQRDGQKKQAGMGDLGWAQALEQYRPILSYDELGGMLSGKPSDLHDAIQKVLGVEHVSGALQRIRERHKERKDPGATAGKSRVQLRKEAEQLDDPRAADLGKALAKTRPDVAAIRALVAGTHAAEETIAALRELASMASPVTAQSVAETAHHLRRAVAQLAEVRDGAAAMRESAIEVTTKVLKMHAEHGDMPCPVCRVGQLDDAWASSATELVENAQRELDATRTARRDLELACGQAYQLVTERPKVLEAAPIPDLRDVVDEARESWDTWHNVDRAATASAATALADHLEAHAERLELAVTVLADEAKRQMDDMDQSWQLLSTRVGAWCNEWDAWLADEPTVKQLETAKTWLENAERRLKNERLAPIRAGAKDVWAKLRHQSNIDLNDLKLEGGIKQRRLTVDSVVDGVATGGLPVMSQGELHALGLALFLPRAAMAESPFRFLVLDDPVQAMDPAKVDGLVDVLAGLAETRQVIVFSHDDRLPAAVRRTDLHAEIIEVVRGESSQVTLEANSDPATRYLSDAFAFVKEWEMQKVNDEAVRRVLPGLLRLAVESAARDAYFNSQLADGTPLVDVEGTWRDAPRTRQRVLLAVFGASGKDGELKSWVGRRSYRRTALDAVGRGMHNGLATDPLETARAVEKLVADLRQQR